MEFKVSALLLSSVIFFIYGFSCIISTIITFSLDAYLKISQKLDSYLYPGYSIKILDIDIDWLDELVVRYNKIFGPIFILLSLIDLKLLLRLINLS